jgi:hypothetical protein
MGIKTKFITDPTEDQIIQLLPSQKLVIEITGLCDIDVQGEFLVLSGEQNKEDKRWFYFSMVRDASSWSSVSGTVLGEITIYAFNTVMISVVMEAVESTSLLRPSITTYNSKFHDVVMKRKEESIEDDCRIKDF